MEVLFDMVRQYGVLVIFAAILLEYACFPLPSEILLPLAGVLCARLGIPWIIIYLGSILAGLVGSSVCYGVGRWGGQALLQAVMRRIPKSQAGISKGQMIFDRYHKRAVCFSRLIPICRTYISFIAGAGGQRLSSFLIYSAAGIALWNAALLTAGYALGDDWPQIVLYYRQFQYGLLAVAIVLVVIWLIRRYKIAKSGAKG